MNNKTSLTFINAIAGNREKAISTVNTINDLSAMAFFSI